MIVEAVIIALVLTCKKSDVVLFLLKAWRCYQLDTIGENGAPCPCSESRKRPTHDAGIQSIALLPASIKTRSYVCTDENTIDSGKPTRITFDSNPIK